MRTLFKVLLFLFPASLALFFGLFFGLNYPEIVRHGWPAATCNILSSKIAERYCCETSCQRNTCQSAPSGSQSCNSLINSLDSQFSPTTCAGNSSACPPSQSTCDGGSYCCNTCCQTCSKCTNSCSGKHCTTSCSTYSCNCYCCDSTNDLYCTLTCPTCYSVDLSLSYTTWSGTKEDNVPYTQDFGKDQNGAQGFFDTHGVNSSAVCHYNPKDADQVLLNVGFTKWKWAISAVFGMTPLLVVILVFSVFGCCIPCWKNLRGGFSSGRTAREEQMVQAEEHKTDEKLEQPEETVTYM